jgi:tetratricopeptide (TPR) repeat protein
MPQQLKVMISSTALDLPEHRREILGATLRQGMFPLMMEHLPASDANAISASLNLVDEADIYLGVFAHRYGHIPKGEIISITEMEYNRAVERKIPRLIYIMDKRHAITIDDVEEGRSKTKLKALKNRLLIENVVNFFMSAVDLRAHVINSLSRLRQPDLSTFHYVSDMVPPPEAYIAHPYALLQTHRLIGRQTELNLLTDWITGNELPDHVPGSFVRIMNVVAMGGMGKSALTWKWFNDVAPEKMKPLAGRMWWSFYESDASFENFIIRALTYTSQQPREILRDLSPSEREEQLLAMLDREPFLLGLDGLERILIAYSRMETLNTNDNHENTDRNLRKTLDPRAGRFLRKLTTVRSSRILISSRLIPTELTTETGAPIPGTFKINLTGLEDEDALELWRAFDVTGSREELLSIFDTFDKHPLLIQALAGEVKRYHRLPGDFSGWRRANPRFDPYRFSHIQEAMGHVLEFALRGLNSKGQMVLATIAAFRMPARYDNLAAVLLGENRLCQDEHELDEILTDLEDRGLLGWERRANRYDLHPIVRGVVWGRLEEGARHHVYTNLQKHFESLPKIEDWEKVKTVEDAIAAVELYNTLIGLGQYDQAYVLFRDFLDKSMHFNLGAVRERAALLEMLFPDSINRLPRLSDASSQAYTLNSLAIANRHCGQPGKAAQLTSLALELITKEANQKSTSIGLLNMSEGMLLSGALRKAEAAALRALITARGIPDYWTEAIVLYLIGLVLGVKGNYVKADLALQRSLTIFEATKEYGGVATAFLAQLELWRNNVNEAKELAKKAWRLAQGQPNERDFIRAARLQGTAELRLGNINRADEHLHRALINSRTANLVEEEIQTLITLAQLRCEQADLKGARDLLEDVWDAAERGPYPIFEADALNVLSRIEREGGNHAASSQAATRAYRLAWCDGPPFIYHSGLNAAKKNLSELGATEPALPPFDETKFEPMIQVEIDPSDGFHVKRLKGLVLH